MSKELYPSNKQTGIINMSDIGRVAYQVTFPKSCLGGQSKRDKLPIIRGYL